MTDWGISDPSESFFRNLLKKLSTDYADFTDFLEFYSRMGRYERHSELETPRFARDSLQTDPTVMSENKILLRGQMPPLSEWRFGTFTRPLSLYHF